VLHEEPPEVVGHVRSAPAAICSILPNSGDPASSLPGRAFRRSRGGGGQRGDLHASVVVIELAGDRLALRGEEVAQGIAQRALAAMADVQRAGGVGRDELDQHLAVGQGLAAELLALDQHLGHDGLLGLGLEAQVDEAGAGDLKAGHPLLDGGLLLQGVDQGLGKFTRVLLEGLGQLHGGRAGQVAVGGLLGGLEDGNVAAVGDGDAQGIFQGGK